MSLLDLPPELVERIVVLLPTCDVCALRLAGRALASTATQEHIKTNFRTKQLEVTESRLRLFISLTEDSGLAYLLKDLTLAQPVYNARELEALLEYHVADTAVLDSEGGFVELGEEQLTVVALHSVARELGTLRQRRKEQLEFQQSCKDVWARHSSTLLSTESSFANYEQRSLSIEMML